MDDAGELQTILLQFMDSPIAAYDHVWSTSMEEVIKISEWFAGGDSYLAVCLKESHHLIGLVTMNPGYNQPDTSKYDLGYLFNFDYHGKGYALESCSAFIKHIFCILGAGSIISSTAADNIPSCKLLDRLGFQITGTVKAPLQTTEEGKLPEITAYTFLLTREMWESKQAR